ncbi:MAG: Na(+)-translocating NADH-quinone reductase subunit A [Bacteroidota bacterium]|nr:Na(+)-translocating NADH-quinone reductase subunit A [Bacteroidota bacterium]
MSQVIKIKRGKDLKLAGKASQETQKIQSKTYAVKPQEYPYVWPKLNVKVGDEVKAGTSLFYDKTLNKVQFCAPVSGEVVEINRGERRVVQEIVILADSKIQYENFEVKSFESFDKEQIQEALLAGGLWPTLVQRPFGTLANYDESPKAIFIAGFDSAPLAADYTFVLKEQKQDLQAGIQALSKLTEGKLHLNIHQSQASEDVFQLEGVQKNVFSGMHPSGLLGIQINHIDPINKGEVVWTIQATDVAKIGRFFLTGNYRAEKTFALAGSQIKNPIYCHALEGVSLKEILESNLKEGESRIIEGNVLTGRQIQVGSFLGAKTNEISVIPEGKEYEFLGWLFPSYARPSLSKSMPNYWLERKTYQVNTNTHGEERAFVVSGEYEKVLPMDIMPVQLLKSILAQDIESMENLGILEILPEDLALCEFVCSSKIEVQKIVNQGIELMLQEG